MKTVHKNRILFTKYIKINIEELRNMKVNSNYKTGQKNISILGSIKESKIN